MTIVLAIDTVALFLLGLLVAGDPELQLPRSGQLVIVTKDTEFESPSQLAKKAPRRVPLVMSSEAWTDYDVPVSPYFVYVDGQSGEIRGEGAAATWPQVARLLE